MSSQGQTTHNVWLHFQVMPPNSYYVTLAAAGGAGAMGSPAPFAHSWNEAVFKLKQAGFTDDAIKSIGEELQASQVAIRGPIAMTVQQLAVLGLHLPSAAH